MRDNHWLERFGGAVMYSLFSDYTNYLINQAQLRSQERQARIAAGNQNSGTTINTGGYGGGSDNNFPCTQATADKIVEALLIHIKNKDDTDLIARAQLRYQFILCEKPITAAKLLANLALDVRV